MVKLPLIDRDWNIQIKIDLLLLKKATFYFFNLFQIYQYKKINYDNWSQRTPRYSNIDFNPITLKIASFSFNWRINNFNPRNYVIVLPSSQWELKCAIRDRKKRLLNFLYRYFRQNIHWFRYFHEKFRILVL